jgi:hypothetical protein
MGLVVLGSSSTAVRMYCGSDDYNDDLTCVLKPVSALINGEMTVQEFQRGVRRDKTHYVYLKDNKYFNSWTRGFVSSAYMHHTHLVLF